MIPCVGAICDGNRTCNYRGGREHFLENGGRAIRGGNGFGGQRIAGAICSKGEIINTVVYWNGAKAFRIKKRSTCWRIIDFQRHGLIAIDKISLAVGKNPLVVDFRRNGEGEAGGEPCGGECGLNRFHGGLVQGFWISSRIKYFDLSVRVVNWGSSFAGVKVMDFNEPSPPTDRTKDQVCKSVLKNNR